MSVHEFIESFVLNKHVSKVIFTDRVWSELTTGVIKELKDCYEKGDYYSAKSLEMLLVRLDSRVGFGFMGPYRQVNFYPKSDVK